MLNAELDKQARELYQQSYVDAGIQHNEREKSVLIQDILRDLKGAQATQTAAVHTEDKGWLSSEHLKNEWTLAASFLQKEVKSSSMANEDKHAKEKTALSMILKLQDQAERDGKVDFVEGKKLSAYVKDVFETHQKTMGRPAIGERNRPDLEYASEQIAHAIAHGTMHPMALVHLVGDGSIVRNGGKTIATRAEVTQSIATMTSKMPAKYAVDPDKYLSESNYSEAEAKEMVEKLPPAARDMFLSLMPDEVKTRLGVSDAEIAQIHLRAQDQLAQNMQMMVFDIASRGDDELKAQHMTDKEIEFVRKVAKESKAQGVASVLAAVSTHGKFKDGIEFALVNDKSYWQSIAEGKHFGDSYHAANDELYSERVKREATEKLVDERARKLIEEREREKESGGKSHVEKYAAQHAEDKGEKKHADAVRPDASSLASSHVEKVEGKTRHAANDAQPEKDTPPSLASKILQQRQVANGHTQRHA